MEAQSTILLVEDNPDDVFLFRRALREGGIPFDVHVAEGGEEAIEYLSRACEGSNHPDYPVPRFIILDNKMPGASGSDLLLWICEHPLCRVIPMVVLSGTGSPSEVKLAFDRGAHGFFIKPTGSGELCEMMKMIFHYWAVSQVPPVRDYAIAG
jgi:CheY-like chemotaxis protein